MASPKAVDVRNLTFRFADGAPPALEDVNLTLERGSRCLLIGANGAGKSTLLRILAGKRMASTEVKVFDHDVFRNPPSGVTYLGTEWAMNPVVRSDITVSHFLDSVGGYRHKERRDRLLDILDVDLAWHMHAISDGERRRVQLCMGLMEPWNLLLLDEVTVDLDVCVRADLLDFLKEETVERGATIIYATHIFDGLQSFPTHLVHMRLGTTVTRDPIPYPPPAPASLLNSSTTSFADLPKLGLPSRPELEAAQTQAEGSTLLQIALAWLREDRKERRRREEEEDRRNEEVGKTKARRRGAWRGVETTDSEKFFRQYDYNH